MRPLETDTRQIARTYEYGPILARHINWNSIGAEAQALGASFEAILHQHGGITVTIYWPTDTP
jgi:hypothetical protein